MMIGLISGAMGPFSNAPIDTIKTRKFLRVASHLMSYLRYYSTQVCKSRLRSLASLGYNAS